MNRLERWYLNLVYCWLGYAGAGVDRTQEWHLKGNWGLIYWFKGDEEGMGGGRFPTLVPESSQLSRTLERSFQILLRSCSANLYRLREHKARGRFRISMYGVKGDFCKSRPLDRCHRPNPGCSLFREREKFGDSGFSWFHLDFFSQDGKAKLRES